MMLTLGSYLYSVHQKIFGGYLMRLAYEVRNLCSCSYPKSFFMLTVLF